MNAPQILLRALAGAMEGLQAEEAFRQAEIIGVGMGRFDKAEHAKVVRRWRRAIGGEDNLKRLRGQRGDLALLASLGMKVHDGSR